MRTPDHELEDTRQPPDEPEIHVSRHDVDDCIDEADVDLGYEFGEWIANETTTPETRKLSYLSPEGWPDYLKATIEAFGDDVREKYETAATERESERRADADRNRGR